jgi:amino-acid N-acetyltransferase
MTSSQARSDVSASSKAGVSVRPAVVADTRRVASLVRPYALANTLIRQDLVSYFESIQEFTIAEVSADETPDDGGPAPVGEPAAGPAEDPMVTPEGMRVVGCGALHVMWDDIGEVRTLAVDQDHLRRGIGGLLLEELIDRARRIGLQRVFCLTFEVDFFSRHGFEVIEGTPVGVDVQAELMRSHDDGVAEFLDLARVKPNTLGNTRMLLDL